MKTMWRGCLVAFAFSCINAYPSKPQMQGKMYVSKTKVSDLESSASGYVYKDAPVAKYIELIDETLEDFKEAPKSKSKEKTEDERFAIDPLPLKVEPEAEMLPAHYTAVKPPGVDHMELVFLEPFALGTNLKSAKLIEGSGETAEPKSLEFEEGGGKKFAAIKHAVNGLKGEKGYKKAEAFDEGKKGEHEKENHKGQYHEAAGKRKAHSGRENHYKGHKDAASAEKGASFEVEGHHKKGRNSAGYHNVYHKDEYKKDADFYDSDHKGAHFKKHGRYGEKHVSAEGAIKKGGNSGSGFAEAEASKEGNFAKGHSKEEEKGHSGKQGYDGFFGKLEAFTKKGGAAEGKKYGYSDGESS